MKSGLSHHPQTKVWIRQTLLRRMADSRVKAKANFEKEGTLYCHKIRIASSFLIAHRAARRFYPKFVLGKQLDIIHCAFEKDKKALQK